MAAKNRKLPEHIRYVCIEGVIGAGKTVLCNLVKEMFNARLVLETAEENPFLPRFYENRKNWAFQTQLWFLISRYKQLSESIPQEDLFHSVVLSDYMFAKDSIFASINLDDDELALYNSVARALAGQLPAPDFVVYLQASTDVLLKRIERRARPYEFNMDRNYVDVLNEAYNHFFFHYTESPLLIIDTNRIDFVGNPEDLDEVVDQILLARSGVHFYHPLGKSGGRK